jgi:hypothetical protein
MSSKSVAKKEVNGNELMVPTQFAIMEFRDKDEIQSLIRENLGGTGISAQDLPNITVPGGGGLSWEVPGIDGVQSTPSLEGIIIGIKATRRFYEKDFNETGGGTPPDCFSPDGLTGYGRPGGDCMACPNNQFEQDTDGTTSKRCKERKLIFMVLKDDILPVVIHAPVMSIKPVTQYQINLTSKRQRLEHVYTKLSLANDKSKGKNIKYSMIQPVKTGDVELEKREVIDAYVAAIKPYLVKTIDDLARFGNGNGHEEK